jgi:glycosyltransferase involved in cell wall biosynthesis
MLRLMAEEVRQAGRETATAAPASVASGAGRALRVAVVGVSVSATCGVRAHADLLAQALGREGVVCTTHWLSRSEGSPRGAWSEIRAWTRQLAGELKEGRPDVVLLHYSVFSYSLRGVPVFVHPLLSSLRSRRIPVVTVMHEFAYPWMYGGWRGLVWAVSQRAVLVEVMRASAAVLVTADVRAQWLASRPWLADRPIAVAPVFSNLPAPTPQPPPDQRRAIVGLFGYSYQGAAVALVLDALQILGREGVDVGLMLLGAPGPSSPAGEAWQASAATRGLSGRLSFSGALPPQDLSDALAACEVLLAVDTAGPSSRKGTLAASLASGRAVVAIDGPRRWAELLAADAVRVVEPASQALADAVRVLLAEEDVREEMGARGRAFAEQRMGVARSAKAVAALFAEVVNDHGTVSDQAP